MSLDISFYQKPKSKVIFEGLSSVLNAIKLNTEPLADHTDPKSIDDCWKEVDDHLLGLSNLVSEDREYVHEQNITHNLGKMASKAGIYKCLWRPEEVGIETAGELVPLLREGISKMESNSVYYKQFDADNGWGTYVQFLPWLKKLLKKSIEYPDSKIEVCR